MRTHWISVNERLPEDGQFVHVRVMVEHKHRYSDIAQFCSKNWETPRWYDERDDPIVGVYVWKPIAVKEGK